MYGKIFKHFFFSTVLILLLLLIGCSNNGNSSLASNDTDQEGLHLDIALTTTVQLQHAVWGFNWDLSPTIVNGRYVSFTGLEAQTDLCVATWDSCFHEIIAVVRHTDGNFQQYKLNLLYDCYFVGMSTSSLTGHITKGEIFSIESDPDGIFVKELNKAPAVSLDSIRSYMKKNEFWYEEGDNNE